MPDPIVTPAAPIAAPTAEPITTPEQELELDAAEEAADLSADPKAAPKAEPKKEEKKKKKLKLKVDGKDFEEEFDPDDDAYLTKQFQLAKMGQKRAQQHSELEKEVNQLIQDLKKNPRKILSDPNIGVDLKELAAQIIQEDIENSQKSPEQLEKEKLQQELESLKSERQKEKEEGQAKELERLQEQAYEKYDMQMSQALAKSDLPKSPYVIKKIADYMLLGLQEGLDVTPEDVLPLVREEMTTDLKEMFAAMPEEVVEQLVGKDVINKIRRKNLAKAKEKPPVAKTQDVGATSTEKKDDDGHTKKLSYKTFFGV